jgi:hypothetical protein
VNSRDVGRVSQRPVLEHGIRPSGQRGLDLAELSREERRGTPAVSFSCNSVHGVR